MQAKTAQVCISDLDCDTVELLLRYCYGCLQELPSDHSQVPRLFYSGLLPHALSSGHSDIFACLASHDSSS